MKLLPSPAFVRAARKVAKRNPQIAEDVRQTLALLESDAFHPSLKAHKLKGILEGSWACSVAYDLRIVFKIVQLENEDAILLETIGTHDEVY